MLNMGRSERLQGLYGPFLTVTTLSHPPLSPHYQWLFEDSLAGTQAVTLSLVTPVYTVYRILEVLMSKQKSRVKSIRSGVRYLASAALCFLDMIG